MSIDYVVLMCDGQFVFGDTLNQDFFQTINIGSGFYVPSTYLPTFLVRYFYPTCLPTHHAGPARLATNDVNTLKYFQDLDLPIEWIEFETIHTLPIEAQVFQLVLHVKHFDWMEALMEEFSEKNDDWGKDVMEEIESLANEPESIENPTESIENPTKSMDNPTESVENPPEPMNNPHVSVENPPESLANPPESMANPPESVENPPETMTNSPVSVENPPESMDNPPEPMTNSPVSVENPTEPMDNPHVSVENIPEPMANPQESVENQPDPMANQPVSKSVNKRLKHAQWVRKCKRLSRRQYSTTTRKFAKVV